MASPIPKNRLRSCEVHGIVGGGAGGSGVCPACHVDVEVRPDDVIEAEPLDVRWAVKPSTLIELIPLTEEYLEDMDEGPLWIGLAELPKKEMPAGYTEQERWFNVLRYQFGAWEKTIIRDGNARETMETLREKGYGSSNASNSERGAE